MSKERESAKSIKLGARFWGLLTFLFLVFGFLCFVLFSQASKKYDEREAYINDLQKEIEQSNIKHAKALAGASEELYRQGKRNDAIYVLKDVMEKGEDVPQVRYALTQALGVYASDISYVPIKNLRLEQEAVSLSLSENRTRMILKDAIGNCLFMDTQTMDVITVVDDLLQGEESFWIGERWFYIDEDKDIAVCMEDGSKLLVEEGDFAYLGYPVDRNLYAYAHREVVVINPENGKVLKRFVTPQLNKLMEVEDIFLTTESIFILTRTAADLQLSEYTPEGEFIRRHDLEDFSIGNHAVSGTFFYYKTTSPEFGDQLVCYDLQEREIIWRSACSLSEVRELTAHPDGNGKGIWITDRNTVMAYDASGSCVFEEHFECEVLSLETRARKDYVRILLGDNTYRIVSTEYWDCTEHSFYDKKPGNDATIMAASAESVFVFFADKKELCGYGVSKNLQQSYVEDVDTGVVNKRGTLQMVCNDTEKKREYILYDFATGKERVRIENEYRSFAFVEDGSKYFILYGSTLDVCSVKDGSVVYSFEYASQPLFSADFDAVYLPKNENGIYDLTTGEKVGTMMNKADAKSLNLVLGNRGDTYALISENMKEVFIYKTRRQELLAQGEMDLRYAKEIFFSTDGKLLCVLNASDALELYDAETLEKRTTIIGLDKPGTNLCLWYETAIYSYVLDTANRDYILDSSLGVIADMKGITGFDREQHAFLLEEMGYRYVPYLSYEMLMEMGQHLMIDYEPSEELLLKYPL